MRELSLELAEPLYQIFNKSICDGVFPTLWKKANICPVFKKGDAAVASYYRPILLLSTVSKVFERAVYVHILNHLSYNNILTEYQSSFLPGDSATNQLTYLYHQFCEAIDSGKEIRAVFCDISKAFDKVWHKGLLQKPKSVGIHVNVLTWLKSYLSDRCQQVSINGHSSRYKAIEAGVPQGSIMGRLLFLIYINDIINNLTSNACLFADDTSLYVLVNNPNEAAVKLNDDLLKIDSWSKQWLVTFNPSKQNHY